MKPRDYSLFSLREAAGIILYEVALSGRSEGWCGSIEKKERLELRLSEYGIVYTDDMFGRWERRDSSE